MATSTFSLNSSFSNPISSDDSGSTTDNSAQIAYTMKYAAGTAARQIDRAYHKVVTLANSAVDTITLSALPGTQSMAKVRKLIYRVTSATGSISVAPAASQGWSNGLGGAIVVQPGGILAITWPDAGAAVASGSNDKVSATATGAVTFRVEVEGTSA